MSYITWFFQTWKWKIKKCDIVQIVFAIQHKIGCRGGFLCSTEIGGNLSGFAAASPTCFGVIHYKQVKIYPPDIIFWYFWHNFPSGSLNKAPGGMVGLSNFDHLWLQCDADIDEDNNSHLDNDFYIDDDWLSKGFHNIWSWGRSANWPDHSISQISPTTADKIWSQTVSKL